LCSLGCAALALLLCGAPALAQSPRLIPFQGRVTDGAGQPLQGVYRVTFVIYDEATGGEALFTETHADVRVIAGQINVLLGSLVSLDDPNGDQNTADAVSFDGALRPRFLGIKVGAGTNQEMVPRHQLVPSFHARTADTTVAGGVDTEQLADGAVTIKKIDPTVLIPAGAIMPYAGSTAPPGWVLCDGTEYDGTLPEFVALYDAIGTSFGAGSGANLFKVPDLRGQFLRGLDPSGTVDPDGASRTVGSTQGTAIVPLSGQVVPSTTSTSVNGEHSHRITNSNFNNQGSVDNLAFDITRRFNSNVQFSFPDGAHQHSVAIPASPVNISPTLGATSTETRPKNVAVNYICKL
jgi:microcystin-dependent protein